MQYFEESRVCRVLEHRWFKARAPEGVSGKRMSRLDQFNRDAARMSIGKDGVDGFGNMLLERIWLQTTPMSSKQPVHAVVKEQQMVTAVL